jgi:hypothetical protein
MLGPDDLGSPYHFDSNRLIPGADTDAVPDTMTRREGVQ